MRQLLAGRSVRMTLLGTMLTLAVCLGVLRSPADDRAPDHRPAQRGLGADAGRASIRVPDGLTVDLVASEPDVRDPVAIAWDAAGRMYVVEMPDYPLGPASGRIKLCEDRDGDGRFDHITLFAEGLNFPDGVFPWRDGILVTAAPDILFLRDTDGDGKADERHVVFRGFAESNPQHRVNGLVWGLDNWIYGANGDSDGAIEAPEHADRPGVPIRRRDFRMRPDDAWIEPVAGESQYGIAFDDWGNRFVCNNSAHIRHAVMGTRYADRNPLAGITSVIQEVADHGSKAKVFPISEQPERFNDPLDVGRFTAACGIHVYRGDLLPEEYRGNVFVCDAVGNLVHRDVLEPDGPTFIARRAPGEETHEFLASTDAWCRPVYLATGPDGALYVVDMYRAVIEHPEWIPDSIEKTLDLRAGSDRGRIYRIRPDGARPKPPGRIDERSSGELVALLEHPNGWCRDTAQRLLFERQDRHAVPALEALARTTASPVARLHALHALDGLSALSDDDLVRALANPHPAVRVHALRLAEPRLDESAALRPAVRALGDDPDDRVRFQLACTLGVRDDAASLEILAKLASRDSASRWERLAILSSARDRAGRLLAELLGRHDDFRAEPNSERRGLLHRLAFMVGARGDAAEVRGMLDLVGSGEELPRSSLALLAGLAEGLARDGRSLGALLHRDGPAAANPPVEKSPLDLAGVLEMARRLALDPARPAGDRADAARTLGLGPLAGARDPLVQLMGHEHPEAVELAAVRTLGGFHDPSVPALLIERWASESPALRREVLDEVLRFPAGCAALLDAVEADEVARAEIEPARRDQLRNHPDPAIRQRAAQLFARDTNTDRRKVVEEYADVAEMSGDRARGQALFTKHCVQCHTVQGVGRAVGPELVGVRKRERAALLEDVLNPNAALAPPYINYVVATKSGSVLSGIIANESATSITLRRAEGAEDTLLREEIDEIHSTGKSLMPEGLEKDLSRQELADIIEYLKQIQ